MDTMLGMHLKLKKTCWIWDTKVSKWSNCSEFCLSFHFLAALPEWSDPNVWVTPSPANLPGFPPPPFLSLLSDCSLPRWEMSLEMIRGRAGFLSLSQNPSLDSFELASVQGPAYPATSKTLETACYIRAAVTTDALPTWVETERNVL